MKKLEIDEAYAKALYPKASPELKEKLIATFGVDHFKEREYEKIISYEAACEFFKQDPEKYRPYPDPQTLEEELSNSDKELVISYKAICKLDGDFKADYNNPKQRRWYVVVDQRGGVGFSHTIDDITYTLASVGSRFPFSSKETANFFGNTFIKNIAKSQIIQ